MAAYKVACVQLEIKDSDTKADRIARAEQLMDKAAGANLFVLPEVWNVGWWCYDQWPSGAEPINGETISRMAAKAKQLNAYILAGSIVEKAEDGNLYNTSALLDPRGKVIAKYSKMHTVAWESVGALEGKIVQKGKDLVAVKTDDLGVIGLSICYDLRFPELYRKLAVHKGVEVFICVAGWAMVRVDDWRCMIHARATENLCYVIAVNCCGVNRGKQYAGYSRIVNPHGTIIGSGNIYETVVEGKVDIEDVYKTRKQIPAFEDRCLEV
ncbi:MAG: nitrilase-related carbon-nitrogen hydrolase [Chloroflexota bacterium]|nr:nitrilase-related carbon-nitrogen hydrolase [Chloroflexota bacterium]